MWVWHKREKLTQKSLPSTPTPPARFVDLTANLAVRFQHAAPHTSKKYLLETMGSGVVHLITRMAPEAPRTIMAAVLLADLGVGGGDEVLRRFQSNFFADQELTSSVPASRSE